MVAALEAEGAVEQWNGPHGCRLGVMDGRRRGNRRGLEMVDPPGLRLYRGTPGMSALGGHLMAAAAPYCEPRYGGLIERMSYDPAARRWSLTPRRGGGEAAEHEFLVISSALPANSSRWQALFGCEAPLVEAAAAARDVAGLQAAVAAAGAAQSRPVLTVLAGWEGRAAAEWAAAWLPAELMNIEHHPVLQKVVRQPEEWGVAVVLHSTDAFAVANPKAYGGKSSPG
jgi:hypothetical protein